MHVNDIARANVLALTAGSGEIMNLGSNRGTSVRDIYDSLTSIIGYSQAPQFQPARPGEVYRIFLTGKHASDVLNWRQEVQLDEGLRDTVQTMNTSPLSSLA